MKKWVYLMITSQHDFIHCGFSDDILKVIKFYNSLPQISTENKNCYLVYAEEYQTKDGQTNRFKELTKMNIDQLKAVITPINPEMIELTERMIQ